MGGGRSKIGGRGLCSQSKIEPTANGVYILKDLYIINFPTRLGEIIGEDFLFEKLF